MTNNESINLQSMFESYRNQAEFNKSNEENKREIEKILVTQFDDNNNQTVWKSCLGCIDLTTLNGEDTTTKIQQMAEHVNHFAEQFPQLPNVASICVYPAMVETVKKYLNVDDVHITAVSAGFPASQTLLDVKVLETQCCIKNGANEIDIVISIGKFLEGRDEEVFSEIAAIRNLLPTQQLKVILETGVLQNPKLIYKASMLAMAAGADFIKTSTGKVAINATLDATYVMCLAIRDWYAKTGKKIGYKAAGGISTTKEAVQHYTIAHSILGETWMNKKFFRFGASRLANNLISSIVNSETKYF